MKLETTWPATPQGCSAALGFLLTAGLSSTGEEVDASTTVLPKDQTSPSHTAHTPVVDGMLSDMDKLGLRAFWEMLLYLFSI